MSAKIILHVRCEMRAVIRFLCAKRSLAAEIRQELCPVNGPTIMSEETLRL